MVRSLVFSYGLSMCVSICVIIYYKLVDTVLYKPLAEIYNFSAVGNKDELSRFEVKSQRSRRYQMVRLALWQASSRLPVECVDML